MYGKIKVLMFQKFPCRTLVDGARWNRRWNSPYNISTRNIDEKHCKAGDHQPITQNHGDVSCDYWDIFSYPLVNIQKTDGKITMLFMGSHQLFRLGHVPVRKVLGNTANIHNGITGRYSTDIRLPSGKHTKSYWKWPSRNSWWLPINSMVDLSIVIYVSLPEGNIHQNRGIWWGHRRPRDVGTLRGATMGAAPLGWDGPLGKIHFDGATAIKKYGKRWKEIAIYCYS